MQNSIILSETDNAQIVQFTHCGHIGIKCNNTLLSLNKSDFQKFVSTYQNIKFHKYSIIFPDDMKRLIMTTPAQNVQLCFTIDEFNSMKKILTEALILLNAKSLINPNNY